MISVLSSSGRANWDKQEAALKEMERAHKRGVDVELDIYPYQCGSTVLTQFLPQWTLDGGTQALLTRLHDESVRQRIVSEMMQLRSPSWSDITISAVATAGNSHLVGKSVEAAADSRGRDPAETALDLVLEERGAINVISFNQSEPNLRQLLTHPLCSVISDGFYVNGKPHPRLYGTYPELLGTMVRARGWPSLPEAIHKITAKPAARLNLSDRGLIAPGYMADLTVFDPGRIASRSTYETPAVDPIGLAKVIKDGEIVDSV
jgi:dihydroorotase/N-acyl-D-amino-acid deacylase